MKIVLGTFSGTLVTLSRQGGLGLAPLAHSIFGLIGLIFEASPQTPSPPIMSPSLSLALDRGRPQGGSTRERNGIVSVAKMGRELYSSAEASPRSDVL